MRWAVIVGYILMASNFIVATGNAAGPLARDSSVDALTIDAQIARDGRFMAFGFGSLWIVSGRQLSRINASDNSIVDIELRNYGGPYRQPAVGEGAVWVPDVGSDQIFKVDPTTNREVMAFPVKMDTAEGSVGAGEGAVWAVTEEGGDRTLARFNPVTGSPEAKIKLPSSAIGVTVAFGSVWVTGDIKNQLYRIDPRTNSVAAIITMSSQPRFLAADEDSIWVFNQGDGFVQRVDPNTNKVVASVDTGRPGGGGNIAVGGGYVWLSMLHGTPVVQVDARTNTLVHNFRGYGTDSGWGDAITFGAGSVWVSGSSVHRIKPPQ